MRLRTDIQGLRTLVGQGGHLCVLECSGYSRGEYLWIKVRRIERVRNGMWKANS